MRIKILNIEIKENMKLIIFQKGFNWFNYFSLFYSFCRSKCFAAEIKNVPSQYYIETINWNMALKKLSSHFQRYCSKFLGYHWDTLLPPSLFSVRSDINRRSLFTSSKNTWNRLFVIFCLRSSPRFSLHSLLFYPF